MDDEKYPCGLGTCVSCDMGRTLAKMKEMGGEPADAVMLFADLAQEVWPEVAVRHSVTSPKDDPDVAVH